MKRLTRLTRLIPRPRIEAIALGMASTLDFGHLLSVYHVRLLNRMAELRPADLADDWTTLEGDALKVREQRPDLTAHSVSE